ncbi:hypothetical protein ABPG72_020902 [Tetrahymena utriculariae]
MSGLQNQNQNLIKEDQEFSEDADGQLDSADIDQEAQQDNLQANLQDDEQQLEQFFQNALEQEENEAQEYDFYCFRHQIGFEHHDLYVNHMIRHDRILAYRLGLARYFCPFCWRLFVTPQRRNAHKLVCPRRNQYQCNNNDNTNNEDRDDKDDQSKKYNCNQPKTRQRRNQNFLSQLNLQIY